MKKTANEHREGQREAAAEDRAKRPYVPPAIEDDEIFATLRGSTCTALEPCGTPSTGS